MVLLVDLFENTISFSSIFLKYLMLLEVLLDRHAIFHKVGNYACFLRPRNSSGD
jgi:hypothetical protein